MPAVLTRSRAALTVALFGCGMGALVSCAPLQQVLPTPAPEAAAPAAPAAPAVPEREPRFTLEKAAFKDLAGWDNDNHAVTLDALRRSCRSVINGADTPTDIAGVAVKEDAWKTVCDRSFRVRPGDRALSKHFFERNFTPYAVFADDTRDGLFTGYYEASLKGARQKSDAYPVPLYGPPEGLVSLDLGAFDETLAGRTLTGRVKGSRVVPLPDRAAIDKGALDGEGLELLWVSSATDAFFLHIQGSGRVEMADGTAQRVGFAGRNGHPYTPVGRILIERGEVAAEDMSMQAIRAWIAAHPDKGAALMAENKSYIFFRFLDGDGPVGASGVELTPGRSLAVDPKYVPFGVPVWLETNDPLVRTEPLRRLMVAQDAGAAIKGIVRGDVFWGHGDEAARRAGQMKERGRLYILLPHAD